MGIQGRKHCYKYGGLEPEEQVVQTTQRGGYVKLFTIISDPLGRGGFRKGASLSTYEVRFMLKGCCFTPGTIICAPNHKHYRISYGKRNGHQYFMRLKL